MNELITCSMNCQNQPTYLCDCSNIKVFLCLNHIGPHVESTGSHHFTKIVKNSDPQTKKIISSILKDIRLKTRQDRVKVIQKSSLLINQIKEATNKLLEKLFLIEKKIDEYMYLCESLKEINTLNSKSFIELLLKLSPEDAAKMKFQDSIVRFSNDDFKEKIESLFIIEETNNLFNFFNFEFLKPQFIRYFKGQDLFDVDVTSQISTLQYIKKNGNRNPTCLLNDGSMFCCFSGDTFIITPNNWIISLDSSQYSCWSGLIAVGDFVYMFGGNGNASSKFSLKSKNWIPLANHPMSGNCYVSCANINDLILIASYSSASIYIYNISNNSYTTSSLSLSPSTGKTCLATKSKAYIIEYGKNYYESGLNDINSWTSIGAVSILGPGDCCDSYSLLYEDSFYFITYYFNLIQFNLKNKEIKILKTV